MGEFLLHERVSTERWIGIGLIGLGVSLVARTVPRTAPVLHKFGDQRLPIADSSASALSAFVECKSLLQIRVLLVVASRCEESESPLVVGTSYSATRKCATSAATDSPARRSCAQEDFWVPCIDEINLKAMFFQNFVERNPIDSGRLHGHRLYSTAF